MASFQPQYSPWRHGGWYVSNVIYPSGACGCVSRNYEDKKWRIACDPRPFEEQPTFKTRDDAARAEFELAAHQWALVAAASGPMFRALEYVVDVPKASDHSHAEFALRRVTDALNEAKGQKSN